MRRYYFHFRKGGELSVDRRGMWLAAKAKARAESIPVVGTLFAMAIISGDQPEDCGTKSPTTMATSFSPSHLP